MLSSYKLPYNGIPPNPDGLTEFTFFHRGTLNLSTRDQSRSGRNGTVQEPGTLRRLWRNLSGHSAGQPAFSWTDNNFDTQAKRLSGVSTPLRYLLTSVDVLGAGNQLSNPFARQALNPSVAHRGPRPVLVGNVGYRPTVRTRVPSFGSRVPALNQPIVGGTQ